MITLLTIKQLHILNIVTTEEDILKDSLDTGTNCVLY